MAHCIIVNPFAGRVVYLAFVLRRRCYNWTVLSNLCVYRSGPRKGCHNPHLVFVPVFTLDFRQQVLWKSEYIGDVPTLDKLPSLRCMFVHSF